MKWETLNAEDQFLNLLSSDTKFAVFKHSTRCATSSMAKRRVERDWDIELPIYYLDLLQYRSLSNLISEKAKVEHQSPQLLVFQNGKTIYDASHNGIIVEDLKEELIN